MAQDDPQLQHVLATLQQHVGADQNAVETELARVNREMYERNVELAVRNKTLSLLRKMYEIINTSLGVEETAERLVAAIVTELKFQGGAIALVNKEENLIQTAAIFRKDIDQNGPISAALDILKKLSLPLTKKDNFVVDCCLTKRKRLTNSLYDIIQPLVDEKKAQEIQTNLGLATIVLYPITFAGETFGVLLIGLDKHVGDLSRSEREALHELIEVVGIAIDRAKLYSDLTAANEKLRVLDRLKDDFVSVASHELRTPMTAIKSYIWMALSGRGGELTEKQKYYLDRSYSSTDRLIKLVNDMLNISRIESGRMTYDMEKVDLQQLVTDVITDVKPRAEELGIKMEMKIIPSTVIASDPDITSGERGNLNSNLGIASSSTTPRNDGTALPPVLADADKIKEVLFNLVGNSLKFTPQGGSITIEILRQAQDDNFVKCNITDTGAGISKEDKEKLFQKFGLLAGSYTINKTDQQGTGLGLFITKSIIEKHGGTITATSEGVGKGATFSFTLPVFTQQAFDAVHKEQEGKEKVSMIHTAVGGIKGI